MCAHAAAPSNARERARHPLAVPMTAREKARIAWGLEPPPPRASVMPAGAWGLRKDPDAYAEVRRRAQAIGPIAGPHQLYALLAPVAETEDQEIVWTVLLDTHGLCRGAPEIARGQRDRVSVDLADALRVGIIAGARYMVLAHLHPSGEARASSADGDLTRAMGQAAACVDMVLLDHVVLGFREFYSFREKQLWRIKAN